jgi:hypothetical protein
MSSTATTSPKRLVTPRISTSGGAPALAPAPAATDAVGLVR